MRSRSTSPDQRATASHAGNRPRAAGGASEAASGRAGSAALALILAWLIPGAGHLYLGRRLKGFTFLIVLPLMFLIGVWLHGRVYAPDLSQPLVALTGASQMGIGVLYFLVRTLGFGTGDVVAATFEHGNAFIIVAGLLNLLVLLDAYDVAVGRKP